MLIIRALRENAGLTQAELATNAGTARENISRYETGERTPPLLVAKRIAAALHCTVDDLLSDAEHKPA